MYKRKITRTFEVTQYERKCPHCKKLITGNSDAQCDWNYAVHLMTHKDKIKGGEK